MSLSLNVEQGIREQFKRCAPATVDAVIQYQTTKDPGLINPIIMGILERFMDSNLRDRLKIGDDNQRITEDLGLDSLATIQAVLHVECALKIEVKNDELRGLRTLGDIKNFVAERVRGHLQMIRPTLENSVVYTAITNDYDQLNAPNKSWSQQAKFVAFLDQDQNVPGWQVRPIYRRFRDPCRNAKIHKVLSHVYFPKANYSIWVDGSVQIISTESFARFAEEQLRAHDLAVFKHRNRTCAYQEAKACLYERRDAFKIIDAQMKKYFRDGYPLNNGLAECMVLLRRHTPQIMRFNEKWYAQINAYSRRDQLSFNYVAHKLGVKIKYFEGDISNNLHFRWLPHWKQRSLLHASA
ncbi:MAG TPA: glycosyltransferase domain-containing protein [Opitutales bacterium]|nr:glycosyltransferase domain-containing protein [Opitutales bacterium]